MKKQLDKTSNRIILLRNLAILFNCFSLILVTSLFFFPRILPNILKIYLVTVAGCASLIILIALILSRKDSTTTLFLTLFLVFISGLFIGISVTAICINGRI